jgi:RNA-directed DNA polymerase
LKGQGKEVKTLVWMVRNRKGHPWYNYTVRKIPKGNGKFRTIYVPSEAYREALRKAIPALEEAALQICPPGVVHGFWPGRSCVSNAQQHVGYEYTVCFDLADFFDSCVLPSRDDDVHSAIFRAILRNVDSPLTLDGAFRQGLPTSPAACNVTAAPMDHEFVALCERFGDIVYTRYADDLTFSCRTRQRVEDILAEIPTIVKRHGFTLNQAKTKIQCARAGRRIITGVAVDDNGVHPTRKAKRRLRAARHKAKGKTNPHYAHRAAGLSEWCKVNPPRLGKKARHAMEGVDTTEALRIAANAARFS